ncbi:MAG: hypothetical protein FWF69_09740 [Firmicutes bacterium]|nr:hypothetical protein [Bacillota bacterium]
MTKRDETNILKDDKNHSICFARGTDMNGYARAEKLAERWSISVRQLHTLCKAGKIDGAIQFGNTWAIPEGA